MTAKSNHQNNPGGTPARSKKNHGLIMIWILVWMATFVAIDKAQQYQWLTSGMMSMAAIALNTAMGVVMVATFMRFLKELDELQRKIQLNALALAAGITLVGSTAYVLLISAGLVAEADLTIIIMMLGGSYGAGLVIGRAQYK